MISHFTSSRFGLKVDYKEQQQQTPEQRKQVVNTLDAAIDKTLDRRWVLVGHQNPSTHQNFVDSLSTYPHPKNWNTSPLFPTLEREFLISGKGLLSDRANWDVAEFLGLKPKVELPSL